MLAQPGLLAHQLLALHTGQLTGPKLGPTRWSTKQPTLFLELALALRSK